MENFARAILAGRKMEIGRYVRMGGVSPQGVRHSCGPDPRQQLAAEVDQRGVPRVAACARRTAVRRADAYRHAALKAAEHYADRHLDMTEPYWGGTFDASCEDKEGAWAGFQAFLAVYEMTNDPKYLQWAEHAMDVTLTYTVVWDIDMPPGRLRDHGLKTRGWTMVSAQNQHLDVYGVLYTPEIYRMGEYLERDDLKKLAVVMYRTCGQMLDPRRQPGRTTQPHQLCAGDESHPGRAQDARHLPRGLDRLLDDGPLPERRRPIRRDGSRPGQTHQRELMSRTIL